MASGQPRSSTPARNRSSALPSCPQDSLSADVHPGQCYFVEPSDTHEVWEVRASTDNDDTGTGDGASTEDSSALTEDDDAGTNDGESAQDDGASTEDSSAEMEEDDLDMVGRESSEESTPERKRQRLARSKRYLEPYRQTLSTSDSTSLEHSGLFSSTDEFETSPPSCSTRASASSTLVCNSCAPILEKYAFVFKGMVRQGSELRRRKSINPNPRKPNFQHYRDLVKQNEWLRNNIFDALGNYLFCSNCVHATLGVSFKRLARLRNVKKAQYQTPIKIMAKHEVEHAKLGKSVVMPNGCDLSFVLWWKSLKADDQVPVRYPYEQHGLAGKQSNQAKPRVKDNFLNFVDVNSQPNGRREDSTSATHYFLPKFKTIQTPKKRVRHYQERVEASVVAVFNAAQIEAGRGTCSNGSASEWLRAERPKVSGKVNLSTPG